MVIRMFNETNSPSKKQTTLGDGIGHPPQLLRQKRRVKHRVALSKNLLLRVYGKEVFFIARYINAETRKCAGYISLTRIGWVESPWRNNFFRHRGSAASSTLYRLKNGYWPMMELEDPQKGIKPDKTNDWMKTCLFYKDEIALLMKAQEPAEKFPPNGF